MSGAPAHAIFCCTDAQPILTESSLKIHNDPNRDVHDRICTSFMEFALRQQRSATVYALLKAQIGELEIVCENEIPTSMSRTFPVQSSYHTPLKPTADRSLMTPPFTPAETPDLYGKGKQPAISSLHGTADIGCSGSSESGLAESLARLHMNDNQPKAYAGASRGAGQSLLRDSFLLSRKENLMNFPQLAAPSHVEPGSSKSVYTSGHNESSAGAMVKKNACLMIHDHIMEIPTMPIPGHPTQELLRNPLTPDTQYVIHLTSRHDYGPVYSHRYFVCPMNLNDDWIELTLLQWFARGEAFKMKAEKWDIKCPNDSRFFPLTRSVYGRVYDIYDAVFPRSFDYACGAFNTLDPAWYFIPAI